MDRAEEKKIVSVWLGFITQTECTRQSQDSGDTLIDLITLPRVSVQKEDESTWN
jgi:hypothetical protein